MLIVITLLVFLAAVLCDYSTLHQLKTLEKTIYYSLMAISLCVLILHSLDVPIPSPVNIIISAIQSIGGNAAAGAWFYGCERICL